MKKSWLLAPSLMLLGVGVAAYSWWQSPSTTTTVDYGRRPVSNVLGSETSLADWQTDFFSTKYPASLRVRTSTEDPTKTVVGSYMLSSVTAQRADQVGITITQLGNNRLDEESAIKYRSQHPELYIRGTRSYAPPGAYVFSSQDQDEMGIFWRHSNVVAAVDVTGSSANQTGLEDILRTIVSDWTWR